MDFLRKFLVIILTPYQSWIKFQERRQIEKNAEVHSAQLDIAIEEVIDLTRKNATPENSDRILHVIKKIDKLSRLLEQEYPNCGRRMQKRLHITLYEHRSLLQLYQSI